MFCPWGAALGPVALSAPDADLSPCGKQREANAEARGLTRPLRSPAALRLSKGMEPQGCTRSSSQAREAGQGLCRLLSSCLQGLQSASRKGYLLGSPPWLYSHLGQPDQQLCSNSPCPFPALQEDKGDKVEHPSQGPSQQTG